MSPREHQDSSMPTEIQPQALELIQRAEIDMQIATAKKYPRDLAKVKRRMLDFATLDEETAESCFYTLSRGGKTIQGPSVRLAEIAVACYQNLRAASRVIDNNGKIITCQGACHDLENNTLISVEVQRRITKRDGRSYDDDMQVVAGNAGNSIAFRNAVFKVVPGALLKPVYEAARKVAVGDASTLVTRRAKVIARLNAMEVDTTRILARLGKSSVENIGLEDLESLIGLGTAIKDGDTTVDESFPALRTEPFGTLADRVKAAAVKDAAPEPPKDSNSAAAPPQPEPQKPVDAKPAPEAAKQPEPAEPAKEEPKPREAKPPKAADTKPPAKLYDYADWDRAQESQDWGTGWIKVGAKVYQFVDGNYKLYVAPGRPRNPEAFDGGAQ